MIAESDYILRHKLGKDLRRIENAIAAGDYSRLRTWLRAEKRAAITEEVKKANLRGRGGAGFPAGMKWGFIGKCFPR